MKNQKAYLLKSLLLFGLVSVLLLSGCEQAKETVEKAGDVVTDTAEKAGEVAEEAAEKVSETAENAVNEVAGEVESIVEDKFLIGTWSGKFDSRKTVLVISNQNENKIEGKISISYRQAINQEVKGTFDSETNTLTMEDQLHSRYAGTYVGKISDDKQNYSGEFTVKADGKKRKFNLSKK